MRSVVDRNVVMRDISVLIFRSIFRNQVVSFDIHFCLSWVGHQLEDKTPDDGHRRCPKHVEFYDKINLVNQCVYLVIKKKSTTMHGNMNVKFIVDYKSVQQNYRNSFLLGILSQLCSDKSPEHRGSSLEISSLMMTDCHHNFCSLVILSDLIICTLWHNAVRFCTR